LCDRKVRTGGVFAETIFQASIWSGRVLLEDGTQMDMEMRLAEQNRAEDMVRAGQDREYQDKLLREFGI